MITAAFLALYLITLGFGAWLGACWARAGQQLGSTLGEFRRDQDVNDAAASAETACDWGGAL